MYKLICQKPAHFLLAQMTVLSSFFQVFIVLGMYNFESKFNINFAESYCSRTEGGSLGVLEPIYELKFV